MIWETIFFASGSIFFLLSIAIVLAVGFYLFKIVAAALSIEREVKGLADDLKNKVNALSITFAGIVALMEKFIEYKRESRKDGEARDEEPAKAKKIKIAKLDQD